MNEEEIGQELRAMQGQIYELQGRMNAMDMTLATLNTTSVQTQDEGQRIVASSGMSVEQSGNSVVISAMRTKGFPWGPDYVFGLDQLNDNTVRIYAGKMKVHGTTVDNTVAQQDITLTGSVSWICARMTIVGGASAVVLLNAEPSTSDGVYWYIPMYVFTQFAANCYGIAAGWYKNGGHEIVFTNPLP